MSISKRTFGSTGKHSEPAYLDCNATSPMEPAVRDLVVHWFTNEVGNSGSRTHEYGTRAKKAVQASREQIAKVVESSPDEVIFTSGATESNNLAILGLATYGEATGRKHIVSTEIEHKAVLEPLEALQKRGFQVTLVKPDSNGMIDSDSILSALRPDTLLVSVMHVNNETGVIQPIAEIAKALVDHEAFFHVDAAQGFGKDLVTLTSPRIDLISISSHKIYGPLGIGSLVARRRGFRKVPLSPLAYGGGQERGLRPGTLPVPLAAGFGLAAELALRNSDKRAIICRDTKSSAMRVLSPLRIQVHGLPENVMPHVLNFSVEGVDAEAIMVSLKDLAAFSNGSACTSQSYQPSHVLVAMGLSPSAVAGAVRMSWCHMTAAIDWQGIANRIQSLRS